MYLEEVEAICRSAEDFEGLPPWDALAGWLHRFVGYAATKRALAEELIAYIDQDADVFASCRTAINDAGERAAAPRAGVGRRAPRRDVHRRRRGWSAASPSIRMADPEQIERILDLALDGLRYRTA